MESSFQEPYKTLNGVALTIGQALTLRVAIESFAFSLVHEGVGNDEAGKALTQGYLMNIATLRQIGERTS